MIKLSNDRGNSNSFRTIINPIKEFGNFAARLHHFARSVLGLIFRHPVTGTNIIPVLADGRIVLSRRRDTGLWALPGGMVEWGEDIATTVRRELAEETGLELIRVSRLVGVYSQPERDPRVHSICVVVEAEVTGKIEIQDKHEICEVEAFELKDLPLTRLSYDNEDQLKNYLDQLLVLA
ncbi:NUDIX hydrolase [Pleurocapsales cyanobacterium LEGE 10410]|nr:NUDIX hydrolase [Pleurocapsales cyanobacterium LEGE 10410]